MTFGIAGNSDKEGIVDIIESLVKRFNKLRIPFVMHKPLVDGIRRRQGRRAVQGIESVAEKLLGRRSDILISLGGDGTMLRNARLVAPYGTPVLGVNLGKLGFLAETSVDELDECLKDILNGRYTIEERMMLESWVGGHARRSVALNDIVVDLSISSRMFPVETAVNEEYLSTFTGDGVIVSTPTGSTGYALSNGGPILVPAAKAMMISPICPHTLTARPVVIPDDSIVRLSVKSAPARVHIAADGQQQHLLKPPVTVYVQKSPYPAKLVKRLDVSYFDVLRRKLHWGRDVRSPETT